jgi:membrane protein DedA with SNARE-associated domain
LHPDETPADDAADTPAPRPEHHAPRPPGWRGGKAWPSFLIGLIVVLLTASYLSNAWFPTLSTEYPLVLIGLSSANRNLVLASGQVPFAAYFAVAFVRLLLPDFAFYYLGYDFGDRSLTWMERRTPRIGEMLRELERLFGRYGWAIVVFAPLLIPSNPICLVAGASRMRPRVFWTLDAIGIVLRILVMAWLGQTFEGAVDWLLDFIAEYRLPLTVVTVSLVGFVFWRETRAGTSGFQELRRLEDEIEDDLETAEATDGTEERGER